MRPQLIIGKNNRGSISSLCKKKKCYYIYYNNITMFSCDLETVKTIKSKQKMSIVIIWNL